MGVTQPDVRFTTTSDGVDIAYWEVGSGPALLLAQSRSLSHAELEWSVPSMAALYRDLGRYFRVIRFDPRGAGISGEPPPGEGISLEALARDIEAVAEASRADAITLVGTVSMGPSSVLVARRRPELVSNLVLCDTGPNLSDLPLDSFVKATDALVELGALPSMSGLFTSTPTEDLPALEALLKGSLHNRPQRTRDLSGFDVTEILGEIRVETLVVKSQESLYTNMQETRRLVTGIPNAQLRVVPGTMAPWLARRDDVVAAFVSFLTSEVHMPDSGESSELRTIVFTDLVSSTEHIARLGDDEGRRAIREVEDHVSEICARHRGQLIKNLGDGSLITFKATSNAIAFAVELQDQMGSTDLGLRVGMAAGEPIHEAGDVHGAVVAQASRIADVGNEGDIIVADAVRQLAAGKNIEFEPLGAVALKGFAEPQQLWKVSRSSA